MKNNPMPVGNPVYIEGDESKIESIIKDKTKISFIEVEVNCLANIKAPLLLNRFKSNGIGKTIAPVGSWQGFYTSIEILRALEMGYKFKYIRGVYFNSKIIFDKYVDHYYEMKKQSKKNSSGYTISKLMLNSVYGRLGMNPYLDKHVIVYPDDVIKLSEYHKIIDVMPLNNGKELITYTPNIYEEDFTHSNCSIPIAAAITAGARVYMSYFKNMDNINIFYSDTDSLDLDRPLDNKYVGDELGQFKLEHHFAEAVYLGPKVYGGKTPNYELVKVKGLTNAVTYAELKSLLQKGSSLSAPNEKWYKDLNQATILIKNELYTLSITENKRQLIYNKDNVLCDTAPLMLVNGEIVESQT